MSESDGSRGSEPAQLSGRMAEGVLPELLREIYLGRLTGRLNFVRGWERRSVRFIRGNIVHADTNAPGGHLGDLLVRHGLLQPEQLSSALSSARRSGKRLGEVLSAERLLEKSLLDDAVELHVRDTLVKAFGWCDGSYEFEPQETAAFTGLDLTPNVSTGDIILRAVASIDDPDVVRYCLRDLERVPTLSTDPLLRFQRVALQPVDAFVLSRVDGRSSARAIVSLAPVESEHAERSLLGLLCIGMLEYAPAEPVAQAAAPEELRREIEDAYGARHARNHFEVLGLTREARGAELRAAYDRLARRYHPDIQHDPSLSGLKEKIEAVFARLGEAYRVLQDPRRRAGYEETLRRTVRAQPEPEEPPASAAYDPLAEQQRAEELLAAAEALFAEAKYWDALRQCEDVLPLARGKTRRRVRVLLAECYLKNPNWRRQAEEELQAAIQEDPDNADACYLLGRLYKDAGLNTRAATMLRRVLALRPKHAGAAADLASLPEGSAQDASLLKKLGLRSS